MLIRLIKNYYNKKVFFVVALILILFCIVCEVMLPKVIADILNNGVAQNDISVIYSEIFKLAVISCLIAVFSYCAAVMLSVSKLEFENNLRCDLFRRSRFEQFSNLSSGALITRILSDADKVSNIASFSVEYIYKPFVMSLLSFMMIFTINEIVGLFFMLFFFFQIVLIAFFAKKLQPKFERVQSVVDKINGNIQEVLNNIKFIKISRSQRHESDRFGSINETRYSEKLSVLKIISCFNPVAVLIMNLILVVTIAVVGGENSLSYSAAGKVVMLISYAEEIVVSIITVCGMIQQYSEYKASVNRLTEMLISSEDFEKDAYTPVSIEKIAFEDVTCCNETGKILFENLSFTLEKGQKIAVFGKSGCGKTFFSHLFSGKCSPSSGQVKINDRSMADFAAQELSGRIAYVGEDNGIFNLSVYDNIVLGRDGVLNEDVELAVKNALLDGFVDSQKYKYNTLLSPTGNTVSGGEKQRIALARALAGKPDLLIIDNSTSSVDYQSEATILQNISESMPDMTVIFITQRNNSFNNAVAKLNFAEQKVFNHG